MRLADRLPPWLTGNHGRNAAALVAGAFWPLAFAPFGLWPVALMSLVALFWLVEHASPGNSAKRAFAFGIGLFGAGTWWVYVSISHFGGLHWALAGTVTGAMIVALALFVTLFGWAAARGLPPNGPARWLLGLPAVWVLVEWLRSWVLSGFPWLSAGYAFTDTWLAGYAPMGGVLAMSTGAALTAGAILWVGNERSVRATVGAALLVAAVWLGGAALDRVEWTTAVGPPVTVALLQGNVTQDKKWLTEQLEPTIRLYHQMTLEHADADIVVWPEAALPALKFQLDPYLERLAEVTREAGTSVVMGVLVWDAVDDHYYNSILAVESGDLYHKRHLVPFGEFFPVPDAVRNWLRLLSLPYSDFTRGARDQAPLTAAGQRLAGSICYEVAYGGEMIRAVPDSTLLVNISNDGWFGNTIAPHQHLQIARLRAREAGRWMLRATNTGVTAVIDSRGKLTAVLPQFEQGALRATVQPRDGATPYARAANWPIVTVLVLLLGVAVRLRYA
ncbi:MAG: apolipoprotein N-acyltransferase [Xanthomonadaceae bacterium]|nr:apolipoprotein N-acyltransferase [Xanthomonadaceae bacterium]